MMATSQHPSSSSSSTLQTLLNDFQAHTRRTQARLFTFQAFTQDAYPRAFQDTHDHLASIEVYVTSLLQIVAAGHCDRTDSTGSERLDTISETDSDSRASTHTYVRKVDDITIRRAISICLHQLDVLDRILEVYMPVEGKGKITGAAMKRLYKETEIPTVQKTLARYQEAFKGFTRSAVS